MWGVLGGSGWGEWLHLLSSIFQGKWLQLLPRNSRVIKAFENSFENVSANHWAELASQLRGLPPPLAGAEHWGSAYGGLSPLGWLAGHIDALSGLRC